MVFHGRAFGIGLASLLVLVLGLQAAAADDTVLQRIRGNVGYRAAAATQVTMIAGSQALRELDFAITGAASQGILQMPDSSVIGLGANTNVQVGSFVRAEQGVGTTITIPASGGTVRFQVRHPVGAKSSYTFVTPTTAIAVRGTIGLLASGPNGDVIVCLECGAGDVTVTVGTRVIPLVTGQAVTVAATTGSAIAGAITPNVLSGFSGAGLTTTAAAASPVLGGATVAGAAGASGAAAGSAAASGATVTAAAAAAGTAAAIVTGTKAAPTPLPTASAIVRFQGQPQPHH
ncbi:MAG: hypothetical protein JO349_04550 [Candidatus Eremiobacteraeota bacterium]|nr:hypothetical protein [Candidatus Eremiobacteraeota bacterium]